MRPKFTTCLLCLSLLACTQSGIANDTRHNTTLSANFQAPDTSGTTFTLRTNLYLRQPNGTLILADGILTEYNDHYTDSVTIEDALKFTNVNENLGQFRHGVVLAVERRPLIIEYDTVYLRLWRTTRRNYAFEVIPAGFVDVAFDAFLVDRYLNTRTPLNLHATNYVNFTIDANAASALIDRFAIMFAPAVALPLSFTGINASAVGRQVAIDWSVANQLNVRHYEIEKSINGTNFTSIQAGAIAANNSGLYSGIDATPSASINFYRIKAVDLNNRVQYSPIVKVNLQTTLPAVSIYPNPVKGSAINVLFQNQPAGVYQLRIINAAGQTVDSRSLRFDNNNASRSMIINKALPSGVYQLDITGPNNSKAVKQLVIQ